MNTRFDLSSKIALVLLLWVCAFILPWEYQAILCLLIITARYALPAFHPQSDRSSRAFARFLLYSIVAAILIIVLNSVLISGGKAWEVTPGIALHEEGLFFGIRTSCRLLLLTYSILLMFVSTPLQDLIRFLQHRGMSPSFSLILLLTLHFLDRLPSRIHQIFLAQQARGAPVDAGIVARSKALLTVLSPLVLSSIVESIERGTALELRGFLNQPLQREAPVTDSEENSVLTVIFLSLAFVILIGAILRWLLG